MEHSIAGNLGAKTGLPVLMIECRTPPAPSSLHNRPDLSAFGWYNLITKIENISYQKLCFLKVFGKIEVTV